MIRLKDVPTMCSLEGRRGCCAVCERVYTIQAIADNGHRFYVLLSNMRLLDARSNCREDFDVY